MHFLVRVLSYLPLNVLYGLMQAILYPVVYYIVGYRRKVVRKNIASSFPEKSEKERKQLEKQFYHFFADLAAEVIHGYRMSDEEWLERMDFVNLRDVECIGLEKGGVVAMLGHFGCFEWIAGLETAKTYPLSQMNIVYMRLKNRSADQLMLALREKRHCTPIEMRSLLRTMANQKGNGKNNLYGILCDQKPPSKDLGCWTEFLHQQVPFITGPERLAKKFDYPVVYVDIRKKKRGYYEAYVKVITTCPNETAPGEITREFAQLLEENVLRQPEIWLWSHNRFKWKPSDAKKI